MYTLYMVYYFYIDPYMDVKISILFIISIVFLWVAPRLHRESEGKVTGNFRNRIIHAYDSIDDSIVWAIKTNHLPTLKEETRTHVIFKLNLSEKN